MRSFADRRPIGEDSVLCCRNYRVPARGAATSQRSQRSQRHLLGFTERRSLADLPDEFPSPAIWRRLRDEEEQQSRVVRTTHLSGMSISRSTRVRFRKRTVLPMRKTLDTCLRARWPWQPTTDKWSVSSSRPLECSCVCCTHPQNAHEIIEDIP